MGYYAMPVDEHPLQERVRAKANHYVTGRDGGRDIDLRKFATEGMRLYGRLLAANAGVLQFAGQTWKLQPRSGRRGLREHQENHRASTSTPRASTPPPRTPTCRSGNPMAALVSSTSRRPALARSYGAPAFAPITAGSSCRRSTERDTPPIDAGSAQSTASTSWSLPWLYTWGVGEVLLASPLTRATWRIGSRLARARLPSASTTALNELALGSLGAVERETDFLQLRRDDLGAQQADRASGTRHRDTRCPSLWMRSWLGPLPPGAPSP